MDIQVLKVRHYKAGYEVRTEIWTHAGSPVEMRAAYTPSGDYIGDPKTARDLVVKRGIKPEKSDPRNCVCSIGFCQKQQKYFGWSHRAIFGFGIGSTVKEGDCGYVPEKGEWTAKTLDDAKQMAIDFAQGVS